MRKLSRTLVMLSLISSMSPLVVHASNCPTASEIGLQGGEMDDFAAPADPAFRSPVMEARYPDALWEDFDSATSDGNGNLAYFSSVASLPEAAGSWTSFGCALPQSNTE